MFRLPLVVKIKKNAGIHSDHHGQKSQGPASFLPQIKKRIKQVMGQQAWEAHVSVKTTEGSVNEFMNRGNSGREILGQALRNSWDWAVRGWILALSPNSYPIKVNYVQWGKSGSSQCACGQSAESFIHLQLSCPLEHRRNVDRRPTIV